MEQMTLMKSCMEKKNDFVKTNIQSTTDKKGKQVWFFDELPSHVIATPRNQGASSNQMHNINHVHVDEEAVEMIVAICSL